jgi:hypothetical protein
MFIGAYHENQVVPEIANGKPSKILLNSLGASFLNPQKNERRTFHKII